MEQLRKALEVTENRDKAISVLQEAVKYLTVKLNGLQQCEVPLVASYASVTWALELLQQVPHLHTTAASPKFSVWQPNFVGRQTNQLVAHASVQVRKERQLYFFKKSELRPPILENVPRVAYTTIELTP